MTAVVAAAIGVDSVACSFVETCDYSILYHAVESHSALKLSRMPSNVHHF